MAAKTYDTKDVLPQWVIACPKSGTSATNDTSLLKSGAYADLTIQCGDFEFLVHKSIVCMQSGYFNTACKEGRWKVCSDLDRVIVSAS